MKIKLLTPAEQIELLTSIKCELINGANTKGKYLCNIYFNKTHQSRKFYLNRASVAFRNRAKHFKTQVPLFTFTNAKQFGGSLKSINRGGWWTYCEIVSRVRFLDWMIEENKKLIN